MSEIAIEVSGISKCYRIGESKANYRTIREYVVDKAKAPFKKTLDLIHGSAYGAAGLTKEIWALKDVSFEVREGEVLGIIGPNGAGKTTILKVLSRITEPTSGKAEIFGRVGSLLEVGTGMHPELTGRENIFLNGAVLGMRKAEIDRRFSDIVDFSGVEKFVDTPLKHYSSGMQVRLAFSIAAHLDPEILFVDEVLAVGDASFQEKCLGKMGSIVKEGRTIIFVSHNMAAIMDLCSKAILIDNGEIRYQGSTRDTIDRYLEESITLEGAALFDAEHRRTGELGFTGLNILDVNGRTTPQVFVESGVNIEICYQVTEAVNMAQVSFELLNASGVCVLCSTDFDDLEEGARDKQLGKYAARCFIPQDFLRPGRYWVNLASSIPGVRMLDEIQHAISFEVMDSGTSLEYKLAQGRRGVIAPRLAWETTREEGR